MHGIEFLQTALPEQLNVSAPKIFDAHESDLEADVLNSVDHWYIPGARHL
jgi:hypothetical protein